MRDTDPRALIDQAISHLHVSEDLSGFEWFGRYYSAGCVSSPDTNTGARKSLVEAITGCLYENFYCLGAAGPFVEQSARDRRTGHSEFVGSVLDANTTRVAWCEMNVLRVTQTAVVGSLGTVAVHTDRESKLIRSSSGKALPATDNSDFPSVILVGGKSWSLSASPGFIVMYGKRQLRTTSALHRVYWNLHPSGVSAFVSAASRHLNRLIVGFSMKVLADPLSYNRRADTAVMYLDARATNAQDAVAETHREISRHLRDDVPALTYGIAPGLAVAANPEQGESFGIYCCRLIAEACVSAAEQKCASREEVVSSVDRVFADQRIDLRQPYRLASADVDYISKLKARVHQASLVQSDGPAADRGLLSRGQSPQLSRDQWPQQSWIGLAEQIGQQLVAEAFWNDRRCQWVGTETVATNQQAFRTLSVSLYSGAAGIGHFLAELAIRVEHVEHKEAFTETALGALRQALSAPRDAGASGGLYAGSLGIAVVAARAARGLAYPALAEEAADFARRVAANLSTPEGCPDLLTGAAGQILGLLALASLLRDKSFEDRAVERGETLLDQAERENERWSWPNPLLESSHNLTGLSHGNAGIALALGELWRRTGNESFLTAATGAMAYEDAAFSVRQANWPDYRTLGLGTRNVQWPNFWCHGGAGIILSRLQVSRLTGLSGPTARVRLATEALRRSVDDSLRQRDANFTLCHGLSGNAEALWAASEAGDGALDWQKNAAATAAKCMRTGANAYSPFGSWPCGANADNPSLLLGRAGIGYAYLRLHDPSVPSVLVFDPTTWSQDPPRSVAPSGQGHARRTSVLLCASERDGDR